MQTVQELVKLTIENYHGDDVKFHNNYSGRGMYGRQCIGISGSLPDCMQVVGEVIKDAYADPETPNNMEWEENLVDILLDFSKDSLGMDVILYWPDLSPLPTNTTADPTVNQM